MTYTMFMKLGFLSKYRNMSLKSIILSFLFCFRYSTKNKTPQNQSIKRSCCTQTRDRTGMEVNPLVFETSASTDSAIWALADAKVSYFSKLTNFFYVLFSLKQFYLQFKLTCRFTINRNYFCSISHQ